MNRSLLVLLVASCMLTLGCGGTQGLDGLVPVKGVVTYNGEPVEGATVTFAPAAAGGKAAVAITDASGGYSLTTKDPGDGIMPGDYMVTVSKTETKGGLSGEEAQEWVAKHPGTPPPSPEITELLPEKYKVARNSGLKASVSEGNDNSIDLALED